MSCELKYFSKEDFMKLIQKDIIGESINLGEKIEKR